MPAAADARAERIRDVNTRYHDLAADSYDSKWGIDFADTGRAQVTAKLKKALGAEPATFRHALEIGAGTGYFSLNLLSAGTIERVTATDIAPGMLRALEANAAELGIEVETVVTDAERLPFADGASTWSSATRCSITSPTSTVRRPSSSGFSSPAARSSSAASHPPTAIRSLPSRSGRPSPPRRSGAAPSAPASATIDGGADPDYGHALEAEVDVHAFDPAAIKRIFGHAGFTDVRVRGEELLANIYGWWLRTVESTATPDEIPDRWRLFAFRSYLSLQRVDSSLLEPHLPPEIFYNLVFSARKPD